MINDFLHGIWIGPRVEAGPGLFFAHARGLVINPSTKIGRNCRVLNQVTIGGSEVIIGDNVEINAGVCIICNERGSNKLTIGNNVIIGAGAVVIRDVPDGSVMVGVPARQVKTITEDDNWVNFYKRQCNKNGRCKWKQ